MSEPEQLAKDYLSKERLYVSLQHQFDRAVRDAFMEGYRRGIDAERMKQKPKLPGKVEAKTDTQSDLPVRQQSNRVLRMKEVAQKLGVSRVTIYRMSRDGAFPRKIQITRHTAGWREVDIDQWIAGKLEITRR